jgi:hypothetical protein
MKTKLALIITLAGCFLCGNIFADPPLPGAIFTTDSTCTGVDLNIYGAKSDVYVDGGPAHTGAAGLPPGDYCVQVTNPSGSLVLGVSAPGAVTVGSNGEFVDCYQLTSILNTASSGFTVPGYDDTDNPGGEYKVWVSTDCTFTNNSTKTDNFKVREGGGGQGNTGTICVSKFYDANVNGVQDGTEPYIAGWFYQIFAHDNLILARETDNVPHCSVLDPGDYVVIEGTPLESNWHHTTPTEVDVTLVADDTQNVSFGNVCLGGGGGLTLGFWSNKNGQKLETAADFTLLTSLCLRTANGSNQDFTGSLATNKTALNKWLLSADAVNMAYMLSAQLTAMELNVSHGFVSGNALVYAGACGNTGTDSAYITINDLMTAANAALCADGYTPSGDPNRTTQECLKNALDDANNNKNFVEGSPCPFSFGN